MTLINTREVCVDSWLRVDDDQELPPEGDVVVSLARLEKEAEKLGQRSGRLGLSLGAADEAEKAQPYLAQVSLITVDFPKYTDGRSYSTARLLRDRYDYKGELRAVGNVLRDQLFYMARCGIDSFDLQAGKDPKDALEAFKDFSVTYQAAADDKRPLFSRGVR